MKILQLFKKLFDRTEKHHPTCTKYCPKRGECPRLLCANFSGRLWVEDLFKCAHVQKQIIDLKEWVDSQQAIEKNN